MIACGTGNVKLSSFPQEGTDCMEARLPLQCWKMDVCGAHTLEGEFKWPVRSSRADLRPSGGPGVLPLIWRACRLYGAVASFLAAARHVVMPYFPLCLLFLSLGRALRGNGRHHRNVAILSWWRRAVVHLPLSYCLLGGTTQGSCRHRHICTAGGPGI